MVPFRARVLPGPEVMVANSREDFDEAGDFIFCADERGNFPRIKSALIVEGVGAVVLEDKRFPKDTSLLEGGRQELVRTEGFAGRCTLDWKSHFEGVISIDDAAIADAHDNPFTRAVYLEVIDAKTPRKPYTQLQVVNQIREQLGLDFVENVDNHDFEAAARLGSSLAERTKIQLESAANTYKQSATANKKQELAKKIADTVDRQLNHVTKTLELFPVGQTVRVVTSGKNIFYGTVTKVWSPDGQNGDNKLNNPTAPSSWKMQVLLADTARELTVPLSKVNRLTQQSISITPAESDFFGVNVYELFDQRQTSSRETRQVFTGNILRAYGMFNGKGQVVNFTDNKGRVRQGILMPKGFEIEKTLAAQPVQMPTPEDALRFLTTETQRTGVVKTLDEALSIRAYHYTNEFILTTLATKKAGGKYYLDEKILAAAGAEFHSVGGNMRCIVPSDRIMPVLQTIMQEKGYALAAFDGRETARKMLGIELPTLESFVEAEEASVKEVETEIKSRW